MHTSVRNTPTGAAWPNPQLQKILRGAGLGDGLNGLFIWGYTDRLSYRRGETVSFHVSTNARTFKIRITRDGAKPVPVLESDELPGQHHPIPEKSYETGCGWPAIHHVELGLDWKAGPYVVEFVAIDERGAAVREHHIFFVLPAPDEPRAKYLLVAPTCTWNAYNDWGGSNHYDGIDGIADPGGNVFSPVLSVQRPIARGFVELPAGAPRIPVEAPPALGAPPSYPHIDWAFAHGYSMYCASAGWASYQKPFLAWLESQGYDVDVATQLDLHFRPDLLDGYKAVIFVGHDEYWSWEMRDAVDAYVEKGGNAARFAGNFMWQIRIEDEGRRQICYKNNCRTHDPVRGTAQQHLLTGAWETPEISRPGAETFGLNATRGMYSSWGGMAPRASGGFTVYRPDHWVFEDCDLYYGDVIGSKSRIFGYEVDGVDYTIRQGIPYATGRDGASKDLDILAMAPATMIEEDHGNVLASGLLIADDDELTYAEALFNTVTPEARREIRYGSGMMVAFRKGRGTVFHAATCWWVSGLIDGDRIVEKITRNILDRFAAD